MLDIYLETGRKKTFACVIDWPGWCRSGIDGAAAIQALLAYAPRYHGIIQSTGLPFTFPHGVSDFSVVDCVEGNYATNFGTPDIPIKGDIVPLSESQVCRFTSILQAVWQAFDQTVRFAEGKPLSKGPRGGGRELSEIIDHVADAERGYLRHLGCDPVIIGNEMTDQRFMIIRSAVLNGIQASIHGQLPLEGPRGGKLWPLAYFFRRVAWHVVDHTWEIQDRVIQE